ncbi:diaminopimelate decarboxylase, partial [Reticulomyxa filosa]
MEKTLSIIVATTLMDVAKKYGTPCFAYDKSILVKNFDMYANTFKEKEKKNAKKMDHLICYAMKANSNLSILNELNKRGSGFDIVSGGEMERLEKIGVDPKRIVFSGVGKTIEEMKKGVKVGILCFNVESMEELQVLNEISRSMSKVTNISIRVNPNIDAKSHPYISTGLHSNKFGIPLTEAEFLAQKCIDCSVSNMQQKQKREIIFDSLKMIGISFHIGSQMMSCDPVIASIHSLQTLFRLFLQNGYRFLQHFDIGGVIHTYMYTYMLYFIVCLNKNITIAKKKKKKKKKEISESSEKRIKTYVNEAWKACELLSNDFHINKIICAPGRSIVAESGVLLMSVQFTKKTSLRNFVVVDASMSELLRPSLYQSKHIIVNLSRRHDGDFLAKDIVMPQSTQRGDIL